MTNEQDGPGDVTMNKLYNIKNEANGREGAFPAPSEEEAMRSAAEFCDVDVSELRVIE